MIPTHKTISVLHPYVNKKWWAVKMMIFLSSFLHKKNNDVTFYSFSYDKNVFSEEAVHFWMKSFYSFGVLKFFSLLYIAFKIRKSDYVIIWNSPMHFVWVLSKTLFFSRAKLIWWNHHYPWYYSENTNNFLKLKRFFEKRVIKRIDLVISNSQYLQSVIKDIYNIPSEILSPVLDRDFEKQIQKDIITHSPSNTIFTYGRWGEWKNIQLIFHTYENLKKKIPGLHLIVWWAWEELPYYCDKYENDINVSFLWTIDNNTIIDTLWKSDIFLFPSLIDSFGLVLIESMSLWIPVVCLNKSWARELVQNWVNWYLVDSDNEFIDKAYDILTNSELRSNLSLASKSTAKRFTTHSFEKQLSHIFKRV